MDGSGFLRIVDEAFAPTLAGLGFLMLSPSMGGFSYVAKFTAPKYEVWITYEPGESYMEFYVFGKEGEQLTNMDDTSKTPRLRHLRARFAAEVSREERAENERFFQSVVAEDETEKDLLKAAKELRLVLPKYMKAPTSVIEQEG